MIHKLWCHVIYGICHEVHPTARIDIPDVTIGEFFSGILSSNGRHNRIIGELSIIGSVQFIGLSEIWGIGLPYIANPRAPEATRGWSSTLSANSTGCWGGSLINLGSTNVTGR